MIVRFSFLINSLVGGGTEKVCKTLVEQLSLSGFFIDLYVLSDNSESSAYIFPKNVTVHYLGKKNTFKSFFLFLKLIDRLSTSSIMIFNHELALSFLFAKKVKRSKVKIISRMNNTFSVTIKFKSIKYRFVVDTLMKLFYRYMDFYIFQSKGIELDLINNYKVKGPSAQIPNPTAIKEPLKNKHFSGKKLLYVGRLVKQKNVLDILVVFKQLKESDSELTLTIVGDGPERKMLEMYCEKNGLLDAVFFAGHNQDVSTYYSQADVVLLTSYNEGFPNVLLEALSHSTPVVAYDCPSGPSEIIVNGVNGFLVKYLDKNDLKININKALNAKWCTNSLVDSIKRYDIEKITKQYESVLKKYER